MYIELNSTENDTLDLSTVRNSWKKNEFTPRGMEYYINWTGKSGANGLATYTNKEQRDADYKAIKAALKKGKSTMIDKLKEQYKKHEDVLFPLLVLMALDFFFNDGRFQKKITSVVNGMLDKVTSRFEEKALTDGSDNGASRDE